MIDIFVDGNTWGSAFGYDENFQFGLYKAKMIIAAMDLIEKFYNSNGRESSLGDIIEIEG